MQTVLLSFLLAGFVLNILVIDRIPVAQLKPPF
jgi:hypothetical protein